MKRLLLFLPLLIFTGCASIVDGGPQTVNLTTDTGKKAKATVTSSTGVQIVNIPGVVVVKKDSAPIVISVNDNEDKDVIAYSQTQQSKLNPWFMGNVIFGGTFGSTTDGLTGAAWRYDEVIIVRTSTIDDEDDD